MEMKFKNKETGRILNNIEQMYEDFRASNCYVLNHEFKISSCAECPISSLNNSKNLPCFPFAKKYFQEFAEIAGYEVLYEEVETVSEPITRKSILENAIKCVCGDRDEQYGSPEDNFAKIAQYWSVYLGEEINAVDVACMMSLFKIARIQTGTCTFDSFVDLAGYAACGGEIALKEE